MNYLRVEDCQIAYEVFGSGEPVVLAHGFGADRESMRDLANYLSQSHRVLLFDWRGHGATVAPSHDAAYSYPIMRDDLLALMDHLSIGQAHLIGHSMGGQISLLAALARPERVLSLTTLGAGPCRKVVTRKEREFWERTAAYFEQASRDKLIGVLATGSALADPENSPLDLGRLYRTADGANLARVIRGAFLDVESNDANCSDLRVRTLIAAGEKDRQWLEPSQKLHRLIEGSRLEIIPSAGHWVQLEQPQIARQLIANFVEGSK